MTECLLMVSVFAAFVVGLVLGGFARDAKIKDLDDRLEFAINENELLIRKIDSLLGGENGKEH